MSPKQKKLAAKAPPPNKLDEKDFKVLREEKAKGRGMGLQDESVQPGKVMKAKMGVATDYKKYLKGLKKATSEVKKNKGKGHYDKENVIRHIRINKKMGGGMMKKYSKGSEKKLMTPEERADYVKKAKVSLKATAESLQDKLHPKKSDRLFSKHKKMGGGMMQKPMGYTKGGGADTGTLGERKSKLGVALQKVRRDMKKYGKDTDRLTQRDIEYAKQAAKFNKMNVGGMPKKMGGGMMMQKPMGYKSGMGPGGAGGSMAGRPGGRRPMQQGPKGGIGSLSKKRSSDDLVVIFSTKDGTKKIKRSDLNNMSAPKQKMGGGMMQKPMGYRTGTMVKARGCKLGRTRPTKIT